jgi:putative transposase
MGLRREDTAMLQRRTRQEQLSIPTWETLHTWLRGRMQELVQWALEAGVTELLGRVRYQRRAEVDAFPGYRNGYGKPRKLTTPPGDGDVAAAPGAGVGGAC